MKKILLSTTILFASYCSFAQTEQGIFGRFKDQNSDAPIAGVTVVLMDSMQAPIATIVTNTNGDYGFTIEQPGKYSLQYEMGAIKSQIITGIVVSNEQQEVLNFVVKNSANPNEAKVAPLSSNATITKDEIEAMPQSNQPEALRNRSRFYKEGQTIKSISSGAPNTYFIDGQRINVAPSLVPGSLDQINIIAH